MNRSKAAAVVLVTALLAGIVTPAGSEGQAAKKPKLSQKKITIKAGQSKTLKVKNTAKKAKISWKSKNKKIAVVSKKGKVTAKKVGTTKVVCKVKNGKKKFTLTCKVTVKKTTTPKVVPTPTVPATAVPAVSAAPTQNPSVTQPGRNEMPTPTPTPDVTYHPNWPSTYKDDFKPLKSLAKTFKVGSAIAGKAEEYAAIYDQDMSGILQKHYNSTTFTNLMKPVFLLDQEGCQKSSDGMPAVTFESCKKELQFCQDTGISLRAHVLVWYNQTPDWFFRENYDKDGKLVSKAVMKQRMESYIKQVITYVQTNYPGVVYCWDVVNEAVEEDGSIRKNNNNWYNVYSEGNEEYAEYEYVKDAFTYAKKYVEPGVALVYNDYNTFKPDKRKGILDLVNYVNKDEELIDTVGMQCPILPDWPEVKENDELDRDVDACMEYALEDFGKAGLEVMITELCVRTEGSNTKDEMIHQAERYRDLYQLFVDMDKENGGPVQITSVTTFGISDSYRLYDQDSWREGDQDRYAWLFDYNCKAKLAFKTVYNVFAKKAGVETVEETYEGPDKDDPQPGTGEYCRVEGVAKTKNGILLTDTVIQLIHKSSSRPYVIQTDENGKFSDTLPEGTYAEVRNYGMGYFNPITIEKNGDDVTQIELVTQKSFYWFTAKFSSANGNVLAYEYINLCNREGEYGYVGRTDENGVLTKLCQEGDMLVYLEEQSEPVAEYNITKDIGTEENPENIIVNMDMYEVSVVLDKKTMGFKDYPESVSFIDPQQEKRFTLFKYDESGRYKACVTEGQYKVYTDYYDYDSETGMTKQYYLGSEEITQNSALDYTDIKLHKLEFISEDAQNIQGLLLGEKYLDLEYCEWYAAAPMKEKLTGHYIAYDKAESSEDEDIRGKVTGFFVIDQEIEVTESSPEIVKVNIISRPYELPQLKDGETYTTSIKTIRANEFGSYYKFIPEKDGKYTLSTDAGTMTKEMGWCIIGTEIGNEKLEYLAEDEREWEASQAGKALKTSITAQLEAGKTYYLRASAYTTGEADVPISIRITKS